MARKIVITSGKGGVGKTTVVANLGAALARIGARVAVLDTDIGLNNLDVTLGVENKIVYDLLDVIQNRCRVKQALIEIAECPGLSILPSCHKYDDGINGQNIRQVMESLAVTHDYILIDCPAGIEIGFHRAVAAADEALVVTTPHLSSLRDADKVLSILKSYEIASVGLIVNRARGDLILDADMMSVEKIAELLRVRVRGVIPDDDEVAASSTIGTLVHAKTSVGRAIETLAHNINEDKDELFDVTAKYRGVFGKLKRNLRKMV